MIEGLDSMNPPSAAQARAAGAAGKRIWSGYLATRANVGLARPWTQAQFENARQAGDMPLAYCSGWDDPAALKNLAAAWNLRLCLDDEPGIRPWGVWEQPFLDVIRDDARGSGGLYGNAPVHRLRAIFHIYAGYPTSGDPSGASWPTFPPRPASPCGWQWAGTHVEFGLGVDSTWFDDWFGGLAGDVSHTGGVDLLDDERTWLKGIFDTVGNGAGDTVMGLLKNSVVPSLGNGKGATLFGLLTDLKTQLSGLSVGGGLTAAQAAQLATMAGDLETIRQRIEKDLAP